MTMPNRRIGKPERRADPASWLRETVNPMERRSAAKQFTKATLKKQHTRGPWAIHPQETAHHEPRISYKGPAGHDLVLAHVFDGDEFGSALANARLIAAAPEMYAALEHCRATLLKRGMPSQHDLLDAAKIARAALARAKP